jgi:phosphopantothenate-cysteine ligase/phosphopantothenoylcysteine decarboxylase/phosphopantothenate--cysteine ligase
MNILVTAGNTQTPIDKVRCITNIFTGRTGTQIALAAHDRGHNVRLLTSHPNVVDELSPLQHRSTESWQVRTYRTFDDLQDSMAEEVLNGGYDAVVHCAAVSDYALGGVYVPVNGSTFHADDCSWHASNGAPRLSDVAAGKVKSDHDEVWLRLNKTPKLVDLVRREWGFHGVLVKFKLEVGVDDVQFRRIAEQSRRQSGADLIVANTLEEMNQKAFIGAGPGWWESVSRSHLAAILVQKVDALVHREPLTTGPTEALESR